MPRFALEAGRQPLAQALFTSHKHKIRCPTCPGCSGAQGFNLDSAGKSTTEGLPRRYFACQRSNRRGSTDDCRRVSCSKYIALARNQLKPADFSKVTKEVRDRFEQGSELYQALDTYLIGQSSPSTPCDTPRQPPERGFFARFAAPPRTGVDTEANLDPDGSAARAAKRKASDLQRRVEKRVRLEGDLPTVAGARSATTILVEEVNVDVVALARARLEPLLKSAAQLAGELQELYDRVLDGTVVTSSCARSFPHSPRLRTVPTLPSPAESCSVSVKRSECGDSPVSPSPSVEQVSSLVAAFWAADKIEKKDVRARAKAAGVFRSFEDEIRKGQTRGKLLHSTFDFLFLAETWYVAHSRRLRDRRLVVSTERPANTPSRGRQGGGIYLLATEAARGRIRGSTIVSSHAITFHVDDLSVSGVYLPPSLAVDEVETALKSVAGSTVVLGDFNARFPWLSAQLGQPGPPDRLAAFRCFTRSHAFSPLEPHVAILGVPPRAKLERGLTTDHCLVKTARTGVALALLNNESIGISTDHRYTVYVRVGGTCTSTLGTPRPALLRYRIGLLSNDKTRHDLCSGFDREAIKCPELMGSNDVDLVNATLVTIIQTVCERVLGRRPDRPTSSKSKRRENISPRVQDPAVSVLLYKSAVTGSGENGVIVPSSEARLRSVTAVTEISASLRERYTGERSSTNGLPHDTRPDDERVPARLSEDDVVQELQEQDGNKSCGADGVHMRVLKALLSSSLPAVLAHLFNACLRTASTPRAWNLTDIHLLTKDSAKPRDVDNLRPITLICMHRKIFERLLLAHHFDCNTWAKLHSTQAGFRSDYSTLTNAALVHHLLSTRTIRYAAFIDFEKAFDMVDHSRLAKLLLDRGCPPPVYRIIRALTFDDVRSRVLVNGQASHPFPRTRGVLQGSPISPILFNIYIDELIVRLNASSVVVPRSLFYADDGVLLAADTATLQSLADILTVWTVEARIDVNIKKCGLLCAKGADTSSQLLIRGKPIPIVQSYTYLGFPVTPEGIDFGEHLRHRLSQASGRTSFLRLYSDEWGPAHRLRVYVQFLAPMFEYGAPLVWAWAEQSDKNMAAFRTAAESWKDIIGWVLSCHRDSYGAAANLCGLLDLPLRFSHLRTAFQRSLAQTLPDNPLKLAASSLLARESGSKPFIAQLKDDGDWKTFKSLRDETPSPRLALHRFLRRLRTELITRNALGRHLTRITAASRSRQSLFMADAVLLAPVRYQQSMIRYRMGRFMLRTLCVCDAQNWFGRGHEDCPSLSNPIRLSKKERRQKKLMLRKLVLQRSMKFTDIDFLLNIRHFDRVGLALTTIRKALSQKYHERMLADEADGEIPSDDIYEDLDFRFSS